MKPVKINQKNNPFAKEDFNVLLGDLILAFSTDKIVTYFEKKQEFQKAEHITQQSLNADKKLDESVKRLVGFYADTLETIKASLVRTLSEIQGKQDVYFVESDQ